VRSWIFIWILFGFYLSGFKFELGFKFESIYFLERAYRENQSTSWRADNLVSSPVSHPARRGPASNPPDATYRRAGCHCCQVEPALRHTGIMPTSSSSSPVFTTLADGQSQSAARRPWPTVAARPAFPSASRLSTCPRAARCYKKPPPRPPGLSQP
jgi:hypothetical protein